MKKKVTFFFLLFVLILNFSAQTQTQNEIQKLLASGGTSNDQFGYSVSIDNNRAVIGSIFDVVNGVNAGAAYVYVFNGTSWVEETKLIATDTNSIRQFGSSVSISGDKIIVGAQADDENGTFSGSAYIFKYNGTLWVEEAKLVPSDGATNDQFGISVSISGDNVIIGASLDDDNGTNSGSAYIFKFDGNSWIEDIKLTPTDAAQNDNFGRSVSIFDNKAIVGSPLDGDGTAIGSSFIFSFNGNSWVQEAKLIGSDTTSGDIFGWSVSISENKVIIGAQLADNSEVNSGSSYIFSFNGSSWLEEAKLTATDAGLSNRFGWSVSISGDSALVGAVGKDDNGVSSGAAYYYNYNGTSWIEQAKLLASDNESDDQLGYSVSISNNNKIIGARLDDDNGTNSGAAYFFKTADITPPTITLTGNNPQIIGLGATYTELGATANDDTDGDISNNIVIDDSNVNTNVVGNYTVTYNVSDAAGNNAIEVVRDVNVINMKNETLKIFPSSGFTTNGGDEFGNSVSIDGDYAVIGDHLNDGNGIDKGAVFIFKKSGNNWIQETKLTANDGEDFDYFGRSVFIKGNYVIVGADGGNINNTNTGLAYVFKRSGNTWTQQTKLIPPDGGGDDLFGFSVSISENYAVIGSTQNNDVGDDSGSVYIFKHSNNNWSFDSKLTEPNGGANFNFGYSVFIDKNQILASSIGGRNLNNVNTGAVHIYTLDNSSWIYSQRLNPNDGVSGDRFGASVFLDNNQIIVGSYFHNNISGAAYIFSNTGSNWSQDAKLVGSDVVNNDFSSLDVAISGNYAVISSINDDDLGVNSGSAYLFKKVANNWVEELKLLPSDGNVNGKFSSALGFDGVDLIIGAYRTPYTNANNTISQGSAYHYKLDDITPPELTLTGENSQIISLNSTYTELGATANDDIDGDISNNIVVDATSVNTNEVGTYTITYNVLDAAGNPASEVTRTVNVVNTSTNISGAWQTVGIRGFSNGITSSLNLVFDNNDIPYITFRDNGDNNKTSVMKFENNVWNYLGNRGFSDGAAFYQKITFDNNNIPYVVFRDDANSSGTTVMKYNGNQWEVVGSKSFSGSAEYQNIAFDSNNIPYVAYADSNVTYKAVVKKFDGTNWVNVGLEGFTANTANYISFNIDSSNIPYIAFADPVNSLRSNVMKFDGNSWIFVGNAGFSSLSTNYLDLEFDSNQIPYLAYVDAGSNSKVTVDKFDGNSWVTIGVKGFSSFESTHVSLEINSNNYPYVGFSEGVNYGEMKSSVMKFDGSNWVYLVNQRFSQSQAVHNSLAINSFGKVYLGYQEPVPSIGSGATVKIFNTSPTVSNITFSGTLEEGEILSGTYDYVDADNDTENGSTYKWYRSEDNAGTNKTEILNATAQTYTLTADDVNKYISFEVTPNDGYSFGTAVESTLQGPIINYVIPANQTTWQTVGVEGFSASNSSHQRLALDNNNIPYVVFIESNNPNIVNKITVMKFEGNNWVDVGNASFSTLVSSGTELLSIELDNNDVPYVAFWNRDSSGVSVIKFNGVDWELVGNPLVTTYNSYEQSLKFDSNNIPYLASVSNIPPDFKAKISVNKFDGNNWVLVGSEGFVSGKNVDLDIDANNIPYVVFQDIDNSDSTSVMKFDSGNWNYVGNAGFSVSGRFDKRTIVIDGNNIPYISFLDDNLNIIVMRFVNNNWENLGNTISDGLSLSLDIKINAYNTPYIAYTDVSNSEIATVKKFNGSNWEFVGVNGVSDGTSVHNSLAISNNNELFLAFYDRANNNSTTVKTYNTAPTANTVVISGTLNVGEELIGSYSYNDINNDTENGTIVQWYRSDDANGTNKIAIPNAASINYTLVSDDANKYISFEVIPNDGYSFGDELESNLRGTVTPVAQVTTSIGDLVFYDTDEDGIRDPGEYRFEGATVTLDPGTPGNVADDTTVLTDANGGYLFDNLVAGLYTIIVDVSTITDGLPPGKTLANLIPIFDADGVSTPNTSTLTISAGEDNLNQDFAYIDPTPSGAGGGSGGVSSGHAGGIESESLGDALTKVYVGRKKNSVPTEFVKSSENVYNKQKMKSVQPYQGKGQTMLDMFPTQLVAGNVANVTSPTDILDYTIADEVLSVDFAVDGETKGVVLGIKTSDKVYNHTKASCDRLRGAEILNIQKMHIGGYNFLMQGIKQRNGVVEYAISFATAKNNNDTKYTIQTNWYVNNYTKFNDVYNFQVWSKTPADTQKMVADILENLTSFIPVAQTEVQKFPETYASKIYREKGELIVALRSTEVGNTAEVNMVELYSETANNIKFRDNTLTTEIQQALRLDIADGYEYDALVKVDGQVSDAFYHADGNWGLDYDKRYTEIKNYFVWNDFDRAYQDDEYTINRNPEVKATSDYDYLTVYKSLLPGTLSADYSEYNYVSFTAKGSGLMELGLIKSSIEDWKAQYRVMVDFSEEERTYYVPFEYFSSSATQDKLTADDLTTLTFTFLPVEANTKELDLKISNVKFTKTAVEDQIVAKIETFENEFMAYPNPSQGNVNLLLFSETDTEATVTLADVTGKVIYNQKVQLNAGKNELDFDFKVKTGVMLLQVTSPENDYGTSKVIFR